MLRKTQSLSLEFDDDINKKQVINEKLLKN